MFKIPFKKMGICGEKLPLMITNSYCKIVSIPFLYYSLSSMYSICIYDFYDKYFINSIEYTQFEKKFSILFEDLKCILENIRINIPPEIFVSYYLVQNGFLSQDDTFMANNILNYKFSKVASIPAGYGVCRNLALF